MLMVIFRRDSHWAKATQLAGGLAGAQSHMDLPPEGTLACKAPRGDDGFCQGPLRAIPGRGVSGAPVHDSSSESLKTEVRRLHNLRRLEPGQGREAGLLYRLPGRHLPAAPDAGGAATFRPSVDGSAPS